MPGRNLRTGHREGLSRRIRHGAGPFPPLNADGHLARTATRAKEPSANYIGAAGGVRLSSHYQIEEGARPLTFITTLGGRYAYGCGQIAGVRVSAEGETLTREEQAVAAHAHELAFNFGWAVTF